MTQNDLLLLNGAFVTLVLASYLLIRRKPQDPVRLRLHERAGRTPVVSASQAPQPKPAGPPVNREKSLNVIFDHDGQSFDAFEVLQIPAGSSLAAARSSFEQLNRVATPEQRALLEAALQSILTSHS